MLVDNCSNNVWGDILRPPHKHMMQSSYPFYENSSFKPNIV